MERTGLRRVLVIRQLYYPRDAKVRREVDALTRSGYRVDVLCLRRAGEALHERVGDTHVWRLPLRHRRGHLIAYLIEYGVVLLLATIVTSILQLTRRFDLVQVNTPPDSIVFAAIVPRLFGARVLLQLQEPMPEFFSTKFGVPPDDIRVRLVAGVEQAAIRFADAAITCTRHMRDAFVRRGADPTKIDVVVPSTDESEFRPVERAESDRRGDRFVLVSHGSIEERYGLDTVIRALRMVRTDTPGVRLEIYGEGSFTPRLIELAREQGVSDIVSFHGWVPIEELVAALARADAGVVAMKRDAFRDLTHCLKMYDFVAMRRPAIVSRTLSVDEYFDEDVFEKFVADDPQDLARAIRRLYRDPDRAHALVERATVAYEPYRWTQQRRVYLDVVHRLVRGRGERAIRPAFE